MAGERPRGSEGLVPFLAMTLGIPALLMAARLPGLPTAGPVDRQVSLTGLGPGLEHVLGNIVLVPLGALVVVAFRLTLGIRVLGPFRSILLAFAFVGTGIWAGLLFLALTVTVLVLVRPLIRALRMPYYGRLGVTLSLVAVLIVVAGLLARWVGDDALAGVAHLPIVVLCLVSEAFVKEMRRQGAGSAVWRIAMTALAGVVVATLASIPGLRHTLLQRPELMLAQIAGIVVVSRYGAWRLLARDLHRSARLPRPAPTKHESPLPS